MHVLRWNPGAEPAVVPQMRAALGLPLHETPAIEVLSQSHSVFVSFAESALKDLFESIGGPLGPDEHAAPQPTAMSPATIFDRIVVSIPGAMFDEQDSRAMHTISNVLEVRERSRSTPDHLTVTGTLTAVLPYTP